MANALYDALFGQHTGRLTTFLVLADGTQISHAEFLAKAARIAHALRDLRLATGDRVAAQVEKSPDALALYTACVQAGFIFLPLNPAYTAQELTYFLEDSGAAALICDRSKIDRLSPVAARCGVALETVNDDGTGSLLTAAATKPDSFETVDRGFDDLAALLYTSGTTGRSKGAMLSHGNLLSNAHTLVDLWQFDKEDMLIHALPIFHTHGLFVATNVTLMAGGGMIFLPRFDLDAIINWLPKATSVMGVPTFYTRLLRDPRLTADLCRQMRLFISGSAPLLPETHQQFEQRTGHRILERYGMTETNMNTSNPYGGDRRAGTVGLPLPGVEVKVTAPGSAQPVEICTIGQIEVRGPNVFKGYWNMPEKTAAELREDGFFITGDLGVMDADGYLQIVGRDKDLIISGGFNIYPKEIEVILDAQPGVLESAVIGVPHDDFGETVVGVIVPTPDARPNVDHIMAATADALARFKHPREIVILNELPRNAMGKVQKTLLRKQFKDLFKA